MQHRLFAGLTAAALSLGLCTAAHAGGSIVVNTGAQVIQAPSGQGAYDDGLLPLHAHTTAHVALDRDVIGSAALYTNHHTTYIDPQNPYRRPRGSRLDQGHSIHRAQRLYNSLHALPTRVIRRAPEVVVERDREVRPVLIMLKPDYLRKQEQQRRPGPANVPAIPSVPRHETPASPATGPMALAD